MGSRTGDKSTKKPRLTVLTTKVSRLIGITRFLYLGKLHTSEIDVRRNAYRRSSSYTRFRILSWISFIESRSFGKAENELQQCKYFRQTIKGI